jgi:cytochrome c551/c552
MARDPKHWSSYEGEVSHYFQHEEGVQAMNFEPRASQTSDPSPPRFPPGADYFLMWTAIDRLRKADEIMPCTKRKVAILESDVKQAERDKAAACSVTLPPTQAISGQYRPSASMVLGAAYGTKAAKYDDSAPDGERLLKQAQAAYVKAAGEVPRRERPSRMDRLQTRLDRLLGR